MENSALYLALVIVVVLVLLGSQNRGGARGGKYVGSGSCGQLRYQSSCHSGCGAVLVVGGQHTGGCQCSGCGMCSHRGDYSGLPGYKSATLEGFTSDEISSEDAKLEESNPYQETIKGLALEDDVIKSHKQFTDEAHHRTSTASKMTVLTHDNDVNPRVGLRRTKYNAGAQPMVNTRVISSQDYTQLSEYTPFYF